MYPVPYNKTGNAPAFCYLLYDICFMLFSLTHLPSARDITRRGIRLTFTFCRLLCVGDHLCTESSFFDIPFIEWTLISNTRARTTHKVECIKYYLEKITCSTDLYRDTIVQKLCDHDFFSINHNGANSPRDSIYGNGRYTYIRWRCNKLFRNGHI